MCYIYRLYLEINNQHNDYHNAQSSSQPQPAIFGEAIYQIAHKASCGNHSHIWYLSIDMVNMTALCTSRSQNSGIRNW